MMAENLILGIDIGGSSVKGGVVDVDSGCIVGRRRTIEHEPLPRLARITESITSIIQDVRYKGNQIGVGFPGVVSHREVINGPNMGDDIRHRTLTDTLSENGFSSTLLNDAQESAHPEVSSHAPKTRLDGSLISPARPCSNSGSMANADGLAYGEPTKSGGLRGSICQIPTPQLARVSIALMQASLWAPGASPLGID